MSEYQTNASLRYERLEERVAKLEQQMSNAKRDISSISDVADDNVGEIWEALHDYLARIEAIEEIVPVYRECKCFEQLSEGSCEFDNHTRYRERQKLLAQSTDIERCADIGDLSAEVMRADAFPQPQPTAAEGEPGLILYHSDAGLHLMNVIDSVLGPRDDGVVISSVSTAFAQLLEALPELGLVAAPIDPSDERLVEVVAAVTRKYPHSPTTFIAKCVLDAIAAYQRGK